MINRLIKYLLGEIKNLYFKIPNQMSIPLMQSSMLLLIVVTAAKMNLIYQLYFLVLLFFFRQNFLFDRMKSGKLGVFIYMNHFDIKDKYLFNSQIFCSMVLICKCISLNGFMKVQSKIPRNKTSLRKRSKFLESRLSGFLR